MTPEQTEMLKEMMEHASAEGLPCILCDTHTNDLVALGSFDGEAAVVLGAAPGKNRVVVYTVCNSCAERFETPDAMAQECDKQVFAKCIPDSRQ